MGLFIVYMPKIIISTDTSPLTGTAVGAAIILIAIIIIAAIIIACTACKKYYTRKLHIKTKKLEAQP